MKLIKKARQHAEDGHIERAIFLNERALKLQYSEKLQRRIEKMKVS